MNLKTKLEQHYRFFDKSQISPDPLEFPHRFSNSGDIELSAFISSIFAFGSIKLIMAILEKVHNVMGDSPYDFIKSFSEEKHASLFDDINYRFYKSSDVVNLFTILNKFIISHGSLAEVFKEQYSRESSNLKDSITAFSEKLIFAGRQGSINHAMKFMFPEPYRNSACKRMNLFLRWMVRKDELDFGLWNEIKTSQLVIPVDTHIAKICTELGLTTKRNISWGMAEEITENLKEFDSEDPVRYDFAICHIGMRKMNF